MAGLAVLYLEMVPGELLDDGDVRFRGLARLGAVYARGPLDLTRGSAGSMRLSEGNFVHEPWIGVRERRGEATGQRLTMCARSTFRTGHGVKLNYLPVSAVRRQFI